MVRLVQDSSVEAGTSVEGATAIRRGNMNLLWLIIIILIILWLAGFSLNIGGGLIHILIVIALILLIYRLATGRKAL
jgi:hypothetical protein